LVAELVAGCQPFTQTDAAQNNMCKQYDVMQTRVKYSSTFNALTGAASEVLVLQQETQLQQLALLLPSPSLLEPAIPP
jgi:hypothetical protein